MCARRRRWAVVVLLALAIVGSACSSDSPPPDVDSKKGARVYVNKDAQGCDDGRSGTEAADRTTPWCSIQRALSEAPDGFTVVVGGGTSRPYPELVADGIDRADPLRIQAAKRHRTAVRGITVNASRGLHIAGFRSTDRIRVIGGSRSITVAGMVVDLPGPATAIDMRGTAEADTEDIVVARNVVHDVREGEPGTGYGIRASGYVDGITIRHNRITRVQVDAIQVSAVDGLVIEGNEISHVAPAPDSDAHSDGIQLLNPEGDRAVFRGNYVHDTAHPVLIHAGQRGLVMENNVIVRNRDYGLKVSNAPGSRFVNNTIWDNAYDGILLRDEAGVSLRTSDVVMINNVVESVAGGEFAQHDHNLIARGELHGAGDRQGWPGFEGERYSLGPGSIAVDTGMASPLVPKRDRLGRARRGPPDLGAYERTS